MTTLSFDIQAFDAASASPEQRLAVGQLLADSFAFANPDDPPQIPQKNALELSFLTPGERSEQFVVWEGCRAVGFASLNFDTKQNLHAAHARLVVHPEVRRHGLGQALARKLEEVARREGRNTVTFGTSSRVPGAEDFARRVGAQAALPMKSSRLDLQTLPLDLLRAWAERPDGEPYRLHTWEIIPDEYLQRMAEMMMVMNTAPKGDLDMDDWEITPEMIRAWEQMNQDCGEVRTLMTVEDTRSGQLLGYTETFWDAERAALVYQGATAVNPSARGLGLGKWLKAAMLGHVLEHCPGARWVQTNNANVNEAMLGMNVALGFKPWAQFTEWQVKLPD